MEVELNRRDDYFDALKGIAIILVIIGHSSATSIWPQLDSAIGRAIYSFHMPVFFIISGYFISRTKPAFSYIIKRSYKMLILLALFATFRFLLQHREAFDGGVLFSIKAWLFIFSQKSFLLWFFWALIIASSLVIILRPLKYFASVIILLLAVAAYYAKDYYPFPYFYFYIGLLCTPFVYLGYWLKGSDFMQRPVFVPLLLVSIVVLIVSSWAQSYLDLHLGSVPYGFLSIAAALTGTYFIIHLARFLVRFCVLQRFLCWTGLNSLVLIFCHNIEAYYLRGHLPDLFENSFFSLVLNFAMLYIVIAVLRLCTQLWQRLRSCRTAA